MDDPLQGDAEGRCLPGEFLPIEPIDVAMAESLLERWDILAPVDAGGLDDDPLERRPDLGFPELDPSVVLGLPPPSWYSDGVPFRGGISDWSCEPNCLVERPFVSRSYNDFQREFSGDGLSGTWNITLSSVRFANDIHEAITAGAACLRPRDAAEGDYWQGEFLFGRYDTTNDELYGLVRYDGLGEFAGQTFEEEVWAKRDGRIVEDVAVPPQHEGYQAPQFDASSDPALFEPVRCDPFSDEPLGLPTAGLASAIPPSVVADECAEWTEADERRARGEDATTIFDFGVADALWCPRQAVPGGRQLAVFRFADEQSLDEYWSYAMSIIDADPGPGTGWPERVKDCSSGTPKQMSWAHGQVACWRQQPDNHPAKLRWLDRDSLTYGVLDWDDKSVNAMFAWWEAEMAQMP